MSFHFCVNFDKMYLNMRGGNITDYIYTKLKKWFDQTPTNVNINKRFLAYLIDMFIGGLFTNFPIVMIWLYSTKDVETVNRVNILMIYDKISFESAMTATLLAMATSIFYYLVVPAYIKKGQTFGKRILKFKIVKVDGRDVGINNLILRQILGIIMVEGMFYGISSVLRWGISIFIGINLTGILMYFGIAMSFISLIMLLFSDSKRMLHDYIGNTKLELVEEK